MYEIVSNEIEALEKAKEDSDNQNIKVLEEIKLIKIELDKMSEEKEKIGKEVIEIKGEIKKYKVEEERANENINRNKQKYRNFISEYGFIDEIDKELQEINKNNENSETNSQMDLEENYNENEDKIPKKSLKYKKYLESNFINQNFKTEELEDLSRYDVILLFFYLFFNFSERNFL